MNSLFSRSQKSEGKMNGAREKEGEGRLDDTWTVTSRGSHSIAFFFLFYFYYFLTLVQVPIPTLPYSKKKKKKFQHCLRDFKNY